MPARPMVESGWYAFTTPFGVGARLGGVELLLGDAPDVAEDVAGDRDAVGVLDLVVADGLALDAHVRELVGVLRQVHHEVLADVGGHRHRLEVVVLEVGEALLDGVGLGGRAELGEGGGQLRHEGLAVGRLELVVGPAVDGDDAATCGCRR